MSTATAALSNHSHPMRISLTLDHLSPSPPPFPPPRAAADIDPTCRWMTTTSGHRGWDGTSTENLVIHEIRTQPGALQ